MESTGKPRIFVISKFYLPGCQSGALRTLANLVERLGDEFEFWILTEDHDVGEDETPYQNVKIDEWTKTGKARVFYTSAKSQSWRLIKKLFAEVNPDVVYLNSFFYPTVLRYLILRRVGIINRKPTVITPKGELSAGALMVKSQKKKAFLRAAKISGIYRDLIWQASVEDEKKEISDELKVKNELFVIPDLPTTIEAQQFKQNVKQKSSDEIKLVYLSRVDPKKNLKTAILLLKQLSGNIEYKIFGALAFPDYWKECLSIINELPPNIKVTYQGILKFDEVLPNLSDAHFFFMPTLGENFGHVIIESLSAGTPVIISDKTPWRNLARAEIGWDLALEKSDQWQSVLRRCLEMGQTEYREMSEKARQFALDWLAGSDAEMQNRNILNYALKQK